MTITHYDLFAGIGGFSLALEEVFDNAAIKHIFCEWESFPTAVLRQHWPAGEFYGDIAELVSHTDPKHKGLEGSGNQGKGHAGQSGREGTDKASDWSIVTGGFPCQPFSHAGRRKGTADDRYQWPNMFAVIRNVRSEWVIAENVRGLVTWNEGLVLETVCADLESEGYEVQPLIIPAVAVGAPHRRDRVWIIAHNSAYADSQRVGHGPGEVQGEDGEVPERYDHAELGDTGGQPIADAGHPEPPERRSAAEGQQSGKGRQSRSEPTSSGRPYPDWNRNWQEVAFATCDDSVDDGLSRLVDGVPYTRPKWRQASLKAYGNGIVHQVATQIIRSIKETI